ncbi:flagellar hook-associated protein FlgK [Labrys wisconsinensis]|uniref:Flagellar hook-associated protein 1 n=1 Tax=Labrys wisconsinensis TaxID=425677 RepID=A0ABU0JC35_9HYPH|nr:flagellar hook-associated protein FlgK [Labrys wisconsinensis]MDQ0470702.1 flagellar hook-associated protein 1 FlgK [Labrys wisconsinensis]
MSLQAASSIATSALLTTQVQLDLASANIANADTAGYTRKTATQVSLVTGGSSSGTAITGITGNVDRLLLKSLVGATTQLGAATATESYADQLQSLLGSTTDGTGGTGTSLANTIAALETALGQLADTPESDTLKAQAVQAVDAVAAQLRSTSAGIQGLRGDADATIASDVGTVNDDLATIHDLNGAIAQAAARGDPTADLEDQRNTALQDIATKMDVAYYVDGNDQMKVYTSGGQPLLDGQVHELSYAAAATVTADTSYAAGAASSGISAVTVDGTDITGQIRSGDIGALITQRDSVLPAAQDQLDTLAQGLIGALNAAHNQGTAVPAPTSLTGTTTTSASAAFSGSGTVRLAVTDSSGNLVSSGDLDLSAYATVGDLVGAINGISGLSASIDSLGRLTISSTNAADGVSIAGSGDTVGSAGQGFSDWFGLNDLLTGTGASDVAVRADILATPSLMATASLSATGKPATGSQVITSGSSTIATALASAMTGSRTFAAAGSLGLTKTSFADYASDIVSTIAMAAAQASGALTTKTSAQSALAASLSSETGVNVDQEVARLSQLQNIYSGAGQVLATVNKMFDALMSAVSTT